MSEIETSMIPRRTFLRGAAGVVGAGVLGASPAIAGALQLSGGVAPTVSIAYWDGKKFIPAERLPRGDAGLHSISVSLVGYGKPGNLIGLDTYNPIKVGAKMQNVSFMAWSASLRGGSRTKFVMPVQPGSGIRLAAKTISGKERFSSDVQLSNGTASAPKLREGTYVITASPISWGVHTLDLTHPENPLVGPPVQYVLLTVERA